MVNTPTVWKARYQLNHTDTGDQQDPDIVAIGMGRYVAVWEELDGPIATDPGTDLVGQIFDAKGHRVGNEFQINKSYVVDNEENAALATRPGGGFVMVFWDIDDSNGTSIRVETYDVNGNRITSGVPFVIAEDPGADTITNPVIAMRPNGSYLVAYDRYDASDDTTDVVGRTVNAAGTVSGEFTIFNSADAAADPNVAVLSNGKYVVVFADADDDTLSDFDPQF